MNRTNATESELLRLAGSLSQRPFDANSHRRNELLAGLASEQVRLGTRKFAVVLDQKVYDYDGLTEYVFLLASFDSETEAVTYADVSAQCLFARQFSEVDVDGRRWSPDQGQMFELKDPERPHALHAVFERTYKLRAGPYDTKYSRFRVIGRFSNSVVCEELFALINADYELRSYFVEVGESILTGSPAPSPL